MFEGSCLCGAVRFEVDAFVGPFELCHCARCRKATGSAFAAAIGVDASAFRWRQGLEHVRHYEAAVRERPPGYRTAFCDRCGSPLPVVDEQAGWFEVPAGLLDADPALRPERHIYTDHIAPWHTIADGLPQLPRADVERLRGG
jgi:hypothetical protein